MNPASCSTVRDLIEEQCRRDPRAIALLAPDRLPLTYAGLLAQVDEVVASLNAVGLGRNDRVAVVLPNGPEMAAAFLGVASGATCAPLNPAYRTAEFDFYLADLNAQAVIVLSGVDSRARDSAQRLGLTVLELSVSPDAPAGQFTLEPVSRPVRGWRRAGPPRPPRASTSSARRELAEGRRADSRDKRVAARGRVGLLADRTRRASDAVLKPHGASLPGVATNTGLASADDTALVLHTSGTTSRPKLVPLSQRNLHASAHNVCGTLRLTCEDRCLNVMPLFHIHGLVGVLLASLAAGASVVCTPGFDEQSFFRWLIDCEPTWYSAVPTMHQTILARAERDPGLAPVGRLRLIRSSSASLAPQVMSRLEAAFGVPVIEAYGMTEAAHQMGSNPLPPAARKPGSVGIAAGPDMAIMNDRGDLLPSGELGEIVIRGDNVTAGYENNPAANGASFTGGWFRTGDQGHRDVDGYFYLTGRLKEMINRGGEKVAPREVDEALLEHPAVAQAVTFALPHARLGEDVAAAWRDLLDPPRVGAAHNFFACGGDSLLATRLVARLRGELHVEIPLPEVFRHPTLADLAAAIDEGCYATVQSPEGDLAGDVTAIGDLSDEEVRRLLTERDA